MRTERPLLINDPDGPLTAREIRLPARATGHEARNGAPRGEAVRA